LAASFIRATLMSSVSMRRCCAVNHEGGSDAHSGFGDFDDRDGLNGGIGSGPDLRSRLSGLPACVRPGGQLRVRLHVAASVQRVGIGRAAQCIINPYFRARNSPRVIGGIAASTKCLKPWPASGAE
jgi:hypothetical protein